MAQQLKQEPPALLEDLSSGLSPLRLLTALELWLQEIWRPLVTDAGTHTHTEHRLTQTHNMHINKNKSFKKKRPFSNQHD